MIRCLVIVPVLGRPANAAPLVASFQAATTDAALMFVATRDDDEQIQACVKTVGPKTLDVLISIHEEPAGAGNYAKKINHAYRSNGQTWGGWPEVYAAPLVLLAADDLCFQPGWLEAVEAIADQYDVGVIGTNDNANPTVKAGRHSTHPVVRRCYIDRYGGSVGEPGQVYSELYDHNWVDCELVETAKARGCYAHAHDAGVFHHHPLFDRSVARDATYAKGNAKEREDAALFRSRKHLWENEIRG